VIPVPSGAGLLKGFATALLSLCLVLGLSSAAHATPVTGTIAAELVGTGYKDIVVAGSKLFVLNDSNIKVIDTSASPQTVSTISFSNPSLDGGLARGVYVATDQSVWVTSYQMGPDFVSDGVTARDGGEVIRIDARTNTVTHRFCARSGTGNCTSSPNLEAATGITTDGQKVYVAMQAFDDARDTILVFNVASPSREGNLAYTVVDNLTDSPAWLAVLGRNLFIFQDANTNVVRVDLDSGANTRFNTGIVSTFATTGPDGLVYFGRPGWVKRINADGATTDIKEASGTGISGVAFTPQDHPDGEWVFRARTGGVVAQVRSGSAPFADVGSVTGLSNVTGIAVVGDYLFLATSPTVTQISLNPTVATSDKVLTLDTLSTIAAPTIQFFWNSVSYESSSLPAGLEINASTGVISGTPTVPGVTTVTVTAKNLTMFTRTSTFTITVVDPNAPPPLSGAGAPSRGGGAPSQQATNELAQTGFNSWDIGTVGFLSVVIGAALSVVARRLKRSRSDAVS